MKNYYLSQNATVTLRNYTIEIKPRNGYQLPDFIPAALGCSVSEPSAFARSSRGLAFTKEDGTMLEGHPVFSHLHTFVKQIPGAPPEQAEIDRYVWSLLSQSHIGPNQVNVHVTYLNAI